MEHIYPDNTYEQRLSIVLGLIVDDVTDETESRGYFGKDKALRLEFINKIERLVADRLDLLRKTPEAKTKDEPIVYSLEKPNEVLVEMVQKKRRGRPPRSLMEKKSETTGN